MTELITGKTAIFVYFFTSFKHQEQLLRLLKSSYLASFVKYYPIALEISPGSKLDVFLSQRMSKKIRYIYVLSFYLCFSSVSHLRLATTNQESEERGNYPMFVYRLEEVVSNASIEVRLSQSDNLFSYLILITFQF